jgi:TRAP-type C4-dicarboxylate transport system permease small subunit
MTENVITDEKNAATALIIQICCGWAGFFGCLGYFYIGQWQKALAFIVANMLILPLTIITMGLFGPLGLILWVLSIIDVYMQAKQLQMGKALKHWTFFSDSV